MLQIIENYLPIEEDFDVEKERYNDTFRLWITGTKPELDFLGKQFIWANKGDNNWFNSRYNKNPVVVAGKSFFQFPPNFIKGSDGNYRFFIWRTKTPEFVEPQLRSIQMFLRDANEQLDKANNPNSPQNPDKINPKLDSFITKLEQVRDYVENVVLPSIDLPETKADIEGKLHGFINELAKAVDDDDLLAKVSDYLAFASIFSYSFTNTFLIYIQNRAAKEVLAKGKWRTVNMQPKSPEYLMKKYPGVGAIGLWTPVVVKGGKSSEITAERIWRKKNMPHRPMPDDPQDSDIWYKKPVEKTNLNHYVKVRLDDFVSKNASRMDGYANFKMRFNFLDITDVEQIPDTPIAQKPEQPAWHSSEPDEKADHIYEILVRVINGLDLNFSEKDDMDGAKGSSSIYGDINLLASNSGVGRASTATHELAHALTHQEFLSKKAGIDKKLEIIADKERRGINLEPQDKLSPVETIIRDAYRGRDEHKTLELQAEGVAFVVLRYFGIPEDKLKHTAAYISLWRNDSDAVKANLEVISTTAKGIISLMNKEIAAGEPADEYNDGSTQEVDESDDYSFLYEEVVSEYQTIINEILHFKKLLI